jgi:hypothetical protein
MELKLREEVALKDKYFNELNLTKVMLEEKEKTIQEHNLRRKTSHKE